MSPVGCGMPPEAGTRGGRSHPHRRASSRRWCDVRDLLGRSVGGRRWLVPMLLLLALYGLWLGPAAALRIGGGPAHGDTALYQAIEGRVALGQTYHAAAVAEQRARHYPLRPFVAVRPPALALFVAGVGGPAAALWWLRGLALGVVIATGRRLAADGRPRGARHAALGLLAVSLAAFVQPALLWWHELWAGLLVLLALMLRRPGAWRGSIAAGLAAVLLREFALLLPVVMAGWAWVEGRRREAAVWSGVLLVGTGALAVHAALTGRLVGPTDLRSPGWAAAGGWGFVLGAARSGTLLLLLPGWVAALAVPMGLAGWLVRTDPLARRATSLLAGWMGLFLLIGRPDNGYWGLLFGPLLVVGIGLAAGHLLPALPAERAMLKRSRS